MANKKITELNAATSLAATDVVPVVDVSADETKKITATNLFRTLPDGTAAAPSLSFASDAANGLFLASSDTVGIATGGTQRVTVDGSGNVSISGDLTVNGATTTVQSTTVTIDDKNIELGSVASPSNTTADGGGITLKGATDKTIKWINSTGYWTFNTGIEVGGHLQIDDSNEIRVGTAADLVIRHNGTDTIFENDTGHVYLSNYANDKDIILRSDDGSGGIAVYVQCDGSNGEVSLYHYGSEKLTTKSDGIDVTGEVQCDSLDVSGNAGIGTSSPTGYIHIEGASTGTETYGRFTTGPANGDQSLVIKSGSSRDHMAIQVSTNAGANDDLSLQPDGGNVGIGTSSPTQKLSLENGTFKISGTSTFASNVEIGRVGGDNNLAFATGGTERIRVDSSGRLGINTSSPGVLVDAAGSNPTLRVRATTVNTEVSTLRLTEDNNYVGAFVKYDGSTNLTHIGTHSAADSNTANDNNAITIVRDNRNVGIGTTAPAYNLSVESTSGTSINIKAGTSSTARLRFGDSGDDDIGQIIYDNGGNSMRFHTNASEALRIDSVGNVGIGTSSVAGKLHVFKGNGARNDYSTSADGLVIESSSDTGISIDPGAGNTANIYFPNTANHSIGQISHDLSTGELNLRAATYLRFSGSSNTELMRLDSSGRLLLGTTTEGSGFADNFTVADSGHSGITIRSGTSSHGSIYFSDGTSGGAEYRGYLLYDHAGDHLAFGTGAVERFRITSTGAWSIEGANNYGTSGQVLTSNGNDAPTWQDAGAGAVGGANAISMNDSVKINFGASSDLQIFHNGSNSYVETSSSSTGDLFISAQGTNHDLYLQATDDIFIRPQGGQDGIKVFGGGEVELFYNNSKKFDTKSDGCEVIGELECDSLDVDGNADFGGGKIIFDNGGNVLDFADNVAARFGTGDDLRIYHDGSNSRIDNELGSLIIKNNANDQDIILTTDNGSGSTTTYVRCNGSNGQVDLTHYGSTKFSTKSDGIDVTGEVQCDSLDCDGGADFTGDALFRGGANAVLIKANSDIRFENGTWTGNTTNPKIQGHSNFLYICGGSEGIIFRENGTDRARIDGSGHFRPNSNNTYDLGTSSYRWRNVYTNDLNLSNEGSTNDVDGTWGNYTIQEGEDDLFLINRRNGKKYKFNLTEVS